MPERRTVERARRAAKEGKAPTTQAGEFVGEEIEHVRRGKHGARSSKQAIAIGLSKARRAGVKVPAKGGRAKAGKRGGKQPSKRAGGTTRRSPRATGKTRSTRGRRSTKSR